MCEAVSSSTPLSCSTLVVAVAAGGGVDRQHVRGRELQHAVVVLEADGLLRSHVVVDEVHTREGHGAVRVCSKKAFSNGHRPHGHGTTALNNNLEVRSEAAEATTSDSHRANTAQALDIRVIVVMAQTGSLQVAIFVQVSLAALS
eukprot:CAMPEP_0113729952 /NCGR_PEP_ID=MMETSP0038_2-20120614/42872_1 /TAXON_ID=2898 /ORGANISM="Cryptomonas paramecium" /LENGTH=144 /DNA_ID=CAMNT_0000661925 /DNA_START=84 /DNA_END=516 /DNA_ORIENTATION=- /assembly_acc=CAM_ASM_000170